jgi:hypothetical protein
MIVLLLGGALSGYFTAVRGGHHAELRMALIGAVWGGFIGLLFSMEISNVNLRLRKFAGASLGIVASCVSGVLADWHGPSILLMSVLAAILGFLGDLWVKHVSTLP